MGNLIEFKLFAPYNNQATLKGCFSDWSEIVMKKDHNGYFRTEVDLADGRFEYKFRVQSKSWFLEEDEWVEVNDPYATHIDNTSGHSVIYIKDGQKVVDTYDWQYNDEPLPKNDELVIYELFISRFSEGEKDQKDSGTFQGVIAKLDYLQDLGINAIELMPIQAFPKHKDWGYTPRYYFAVESRYGSSEDLKRLIDECHKRGIRVLLDCVFNHSHTEAPLTQIDYDYWYRREPTDPDNSWGPEFDYNHHDENLDIKPAWKFIQEVVQFWIEEYHIDGFRFDAANQLNHREFISWISEQAREAASMKSFINTAEYIPEDPDFAGFNKPVDSCWHESFYQTVLAHICGDTCNFESLKEVIDGQRQGYEGSISMVNYISCHDHRYVFTELGERKIFEQAALKRAKLGVVLLMSAVGIPLVWMGNEFGEYDDDETKTLHWNLLENELHHNLFNYYRGLITLRAEHNALRTKNIDFFYEDIEQKVLAFNRWNNEGARVVVVVNFSSEFLKDYKVSNFPDSGTWHEWTFDEDIEVWDNQLTLDLGEYDAKVFVK